MKKIRVQILLYAGILLSVTKSHDEYKSLDYIIYWVHSINMYKTLFYCLTCSAFKHFVKHLAVIVEAGYLFVTLLNLTLELYFL